MTSKSFAFAALLIGFFLPSSDHLRANAALARLALKAAPKVAAKGGKIAVTAAGRAVAKQITSGGAKVVVRKVGTKAAKSIARKMAANAVKQGRARVLTKSEDELRGFLTESNLNLLDEIVNDLIELQEVNAEAAKEAGAPAAGAPETELEKDDALDGVAKKKLTQALNKMLDELSVQALRYVEEDSLEDLKTLLKFYRESLAEGLRE